MAGPDRVPRRSARRPAGHRAWSYDTTAFETWLWVLVLPSLGLSIVRYLTFRIRYEPDELVIRSGLLFRNVRHIPYARVQNLDAVQNVFHRALGRGRRPGRDR